MCNYKFLAYCAISIATINLYSAPTVKPTPLAKDERKYNALESLLHEFTACLATNTIPRTECAARLQNQLDDPVVIEARKINMNMHHRASMLDLHTTLYTRCMSEAGKGLKTLSERDNAIATCIDRLTFSLDDLNRTVLPVLQFEATKHR